MYRIIYFYFKHMQQFTKKLILNFINIIEKKTNYIKGKN